MKMKVSAPRILAVDDVEAKRYAWQKVLARAGFSVETASSGREALERVLTQPDLVILDVRMPDIDGLEVCRRIKEGASTSSIPVLHVSASLVSAEDRVAALEGGADGYLTEPVDPDVLVASVKALLRMRKAEDVARATAREWRTTFDAIQDAVVALDAGGAIARHNAAFAALFGDRVGKDGRAFLRDELGLEGPLNGDRERRSVELRWNQRWMRLTLDPVIESGTVRGWSCILADITERKTAEAAIQAMNATLERKVAERTEGLRAAVSELEAFTYTIAHDLRAPLRAIHRFSELLIDEYAGRLEAEGQGYAKRIIAGAEKMDTLIGDLLEYSRLAQSELKPRPILLSELVTELIRTSEPGSAEVVIDPGMPEVVADPVLLSQVLRNLFSNAVKFVAPETSPRVRISAARDQDRVVVSVVDNGIGIPPESRGRLFQVFERLGSAQGYPGTGIGLAIVRRAVDRMGGDCGVESAPGQGSRFWISLPAREAP